MKNSWFKNIFIPHEGNSHKPHFWRKEVVGLILILVVLSELAFLGQVLITSRGGNFLATILPNAVLALTNEKRVENGAPVLAPNALLEKAAKLKAEDMASKGYFSHVTPDGKTPWHWLDQVGYSYKTAGENLAVNFSDSFDVTEAWMNSPTHRANIVKPAFTQIGVGMATGTYQGKETVFVVQFFGTPLQAPLAKAPVKAVVNKPAEPIKKAEPIRPTPSAVAFASTSPVQTQVVGIKGAIVEKDATPIRTSPRLSTSQLFTLLFVLIAAALLVAVLVKIQIQHPSVIMSGLMLLALLFGFLTFNMYAFRMSLQITDSSASIVNSIE